MREGRESESQRPNMSRHLFFSAVLLVVMVCCGSGGAVEVAGEPSESTFKWRGISEGETVESLGAPSLLKVGNDVFAVAEAQCKKKAGDVSFTGVASQVLTTKTADTPEELFSDALKKTQVLEEDASKEQKKEVDVSRPTTAVKGNDIYMLVGQYISKDCPNSGAGGCELLLVKGSVNSGDDISSKKIDWEDTESSPQRLLDTRLGSWTRLIGSGGSGVKMKDETLVFPVEGTKKAATDGEEVDAKTVSLIIQSKDTTDWTLSKGISADGCSDPSVVEWEEGKLMMMTACGDGRRRVYESDDKGNTWTEALGTLSRVWGSNQEGKAKLVRSGFTTATVGNDETDVMLVTLPVYAEEVEKEGNEKGKLHLWLTDNTHIVDIGPVSGDNDAAASSLLYKSGESGDNNQEELIALYEKKKKGSEQPSPGMVSVLLTEKLKRVKEVLTTWKEVDKSVSNLCTTLFAQKVTSTDNTCKNTKITDGLVGFLSGKFSDNVWRDEYLGVNATVKGNGATNTSDGVKFTGRGAGAEWPVGKQGVNQLYHFANYNFTLVATVSIDNVTKDGRISLMGAKMNDDENPVLLGLSYNNKEKKWILLCGGGEDKEHSSPWETQTDTTQYQVAIVLRNGNQGSVYVDGILLGNAQLDFKDIKGSKGISHFYIGGDGGSAEGQEGVSVTVRNVLLYNRPWTEEEIAGLAKNRITIPRPEGPTTLVVDARSPTVSAPDMEETVHRPNSAGQKPLEEEPLNANIDAGAGGVSSAASVATTPSSDADPTLVTRSGDKMQGNGSPQTPEVSVRSAEDGDTAEGTDAQGEKGIHPLNREVNATALNSSLGNVSQGNNTDASTVIGSGLLPSLLLLLLGLWGLAAL